MVDLLTLSNLLAAFLSLSWVGVVYLMLSKHQLRKRVGLTYILGSSIAVSFFLYLTQTQYAIEQARGLLNPSELISAYASLGFIGLKGSIFISVFTLVSLKKNFVLTQRLLAALSGVALCTSALFGLNLLF